MRKYRILLTGGRGLVGRNLLEHPLIADYDLLAPSSQELDLRNYFEVEKYLCSNQPDMVVHAAGKVGGIQANVREPVAFLVENLDISRNIILASRKTGVKRLLNLGSSCMYPKNHSAPLSEEMILQGELESTNEGYALAKIVAMRLCEYISREASDYKYKTFIPCNLYGRYDKFDPAHSHLIPAIIHKIQKAKINSESSVEIWGDGSARREFMYAGDLADALIHGIRNFDAAPSVMNIGLGHDYSINEYYSIVAEVMGYKGEFVHDLGKPVGMNRKLVNIHRQKEWGWSPAHDLRMGLSKTYEYYIKESLK